MEDFNEASISAKENAVRIKPNGCTSAVEILMFSYYFSKVLLDTVVVNIIERNTCLVILEYNVTNCTDPMTSGSKVLQQTTADLLQAHSWIEGIVPAVFALFLGPWSDTNGRRPLLLLPLAGSAISSLTWCIISSDPTLHPIYLLLPSIPIALSGASSCFYLGLYCYISDVADYNHRTYRMSVMVAADKIGTLTSTLAAPYLLMTSPKYGFTVVFGTSLCISLLTFLYTFLCVPESVHIVQSEETKLWRLNQVKEMLTTCFKSRQRYVRTIILLIITNLGIYEILEQGGIAVLYLFTQIELNWTLVDFTRFYSFVIIVSGISLSCNTWLLTSVLKFADLPLIFVGTLCLLGNSIVQSITYSALFLYATIGFYTFTILILPLSRSQLSKLIPIEEMGKIFAFIAFVEAIVPQLTTPLYTQVYKATLDTNPNAVFLLSAGISIISICVIGAAMVLLKISSSEEMEQLLDAPDGLRD